jgi:hypothetical protein
MTLALNQTELDAITFAAAALAPGQRVAFEQMVTAELSLSCRKQGRGPGSLHRIITACQKTFLRVGEIAVGPSHAKYGRSHANRAKAK